MTANELVDLIINADPLEVEDHFDEIATMLYQQAKEIEALKLARCVACGWNPNLIGGEK